MVGKVGFEPTTSRTQTVRASQLRYSPYQNVIIMQSGAFVKGFDMPSRLCYNHLSAWLQTYLMPCPSFKEELW